MQNSSVSKNYLDNIKDGTLVCTEADLSNYMELGFVFKTDDGVYVDRLFREINVTIIADKKFNMNINLSKLLEIADELVIDSNVNKVYFMTKKTYDLLKMRNLIISYKNIEYYRKYDNELWLIHIL